MKYEEGLQGITTKSDRIPTLCFHYAVRNSDIVNTLTNTLRFLGVDFSAIYRSRDRGVVNVALKSGTDVGQALALLRPRVS